VKRRWTTRASAGWRVGFVMVSVLTLMPSGCGSSDQGTVRGFEGASKAVKESDFTRTLGKGKNKRTEEVSRRDRVRILHQAGSKLQEQQP